MRLPLWVQLPELCATLLASAEAEEFSGEDRPQPDVDHAALERVYGDLKYGVEAVRRS